MAATALQLSAEPIPVACYQSKVQELTDVITHHSGRFRRIALCHLSNVADAEDAVQDALLAALTHVHQFRGASEDVHVAHDDRNQFCTNETTAAFNVDAIAFG